MGVSIKVRITQEQHDRAADFINKTVGLNLSKLIRAGFKLWLARVEAESWMGRDWQGNIGTKAPGDPYPQRTGELQPGRPINAKTDAISADRVASFRVDDDLRDRIYNAAYWRSEHLSHIALESMNEVLDRLEAGERLEP